MKHLKKKFLKVFKVGNDVMEVMGSATVNESTIAELVRTDFEGYYAILQTDGNEIIQTFQYNKGGKVYFIPEPNPIVIYFEVARNSFRHIEKNKKPIFDELNQNKPDAYKILSCFHEFYFTVSIYATFLFNSIEAFINNLIPKDYKYSKILNSKTEIYDKSQIQRHLSFEEKIKEVIPDILKRSFHKEHGHKYEHIVKLRKFRDEITHTKSFEGTKSGFYRELFTTSLDFDYENTLLSTRDFINYYEENLIEECECSNNW